jgi:hypothetical protein
MGRRVPRSVNAVLILPMRFPDVEKNLAENALRDDRVKRLVTIGDVNAIVALGVLAAIGDVARFSSPQN